jgi:hypothetical protein
MSTDSFARALRKSIHEPENLSEDEIVELCNRNPWLLKAALKTVARNTRGEMLGVVPSKRAKKQTVVHIDRRFR